LLCLIILVVVVGLGFFARWHLTDMRLKELVIPSATQALGRSFAIGNINVGLLRGIRLDDFASMKSFVLNYDPLPLLQKKFAVSEIICTSRLSALPGTRPAGSILRHSLP